MNVRNLTIKNCLLFISVPTILTSNIKLFDFRMQKGKAEEMRDTCHVFIKKKKKQLGGNF